MLSAFRRDSGALLDTLLTQSLTALIAEGLISLEELAIDGTKVRARAGHNSLAGREKLDRIETAVAERVATLNSELEQDAVRRRTQASGAFPAGRGRTRKADRSSAAATCRTRRRSSNEPNAGQGRSGKKRAHGIDLRSRCAPDANAGWCHAPDMERSGGDCDRLCGDHRADRPAQPSGQARGHAWTGGGPGGADRTALRRGSETVAR